MIDGFALQIQKEQHISSGFSLQAREVQRGDMERAERGNLPVGGLAILGPGKQLRMLPLEVVMHRRGAAASGLELFAAVVAYHLAG